MSLHAPTNFLELCQRTRSECRVSGSGPTYVGSTIRMEQLIIGWVVESWMAIQRLHADWDFMRRRTNFLTISGKTEYSPVECGVPAGEFGAWIRWSFRNFHTASGVGSSSHMTESDYDQLRDQYLFGANLSVRTRPMQFAINPTDHGLVLGPVPNADYTITAQYYQRPIVLVNDGDVPSLPPEFMMAIVYKAMQEYGLAENAPEVQARGERKYKEIISNMENQRLQMVTRGAALA